MASKQLSTYTNVKVTKVKTVTDQNGKEKGVRGFMKVYDEDGQYQFGRAFSIWENKVADFENLKELVQPRRVVQDGMELEDTERQLKKVSGAHVDRWTKGGPTYHNFEIVAAE